MFVLDLPVLVILKTFSAVFNFGYFYIYMFCRKFNAEFNKLIKTEVHRARLFSKNEHTHLCQQFDVRACVRVCVRVYVFFTSKRM